MSETQSMKVGIIGCGNISNAYFTGAAHCENLEITACADIDHAAAQAQGEVYGVPAVPVDDLLADPAIELVINLTIPKAHVDVGLRILEAGKHVYAEKPLAIDLDEGRKLIDSARAKGLRIGSAPDTFLFKGAQTARKLLDDGWIGNPVNGTAIMSCHGHETWHPNPGFYYDAGGGPLFDMGPYYLTGLVHLVGPVRRVTAFCNRAYNERRATSDKAYGQILPVSVDTHCTGALEFNSGVVVTVLMSFDTWHFPGGSRLILQGTDGGLIVGDPNHFATPPNLLRRDGGEPREIPFTHPDNKRMIGVLDMVDALRHDRPHRASGDIALHVLEIMAAFEKSSREGRAIEMETRPQRPEPLKPGLPAWAV